MKKLGKKLEKSTNTVEAYALGCGCTCKCSCIKIIISFKANPYANTYSSVSLTPRVG